MRYLVSGGHDAWNLLGSVKSVGFGSPKQVIFSIEQVLQQLIKKDGSLIANYVGKISTNKTN